MIKIDYFFFFVNAELILQTTKLRSTAVSPMKNENMIDVTIEAQNEMITIS